MIPELGFFSLILALGFAILQASLPLLGKLTLGDAWVAMARPAVFGQSFFVSLSLLILAYSFASNDFTVSYVAHNSNTHLPIWYRLCAVWGGHEGSILLWTFILSVWSVAVAVMSRHIAKDIIARVIAVLGLVSVGFLLFIITTSNPFTRLILTRSIDGRDLNPLLQDIGFLFHPPTLYMGYVGFVVVFAFSIVALLMQRFDTTWVRWLRPWTLAAWCFLTLGITLGSWWAYRELGWGGWWFWDPVENASLMPWLVGTALIHSLAVVEKREIFYSWVILLAITAFSLSLLGTFLVRSGVLTSVHAFAVDPTRGIYMLTFLFLVVGGSLTLYAIRAPGLKTSAQYHLLSKETLLLSNNVFLMVIMSTILLGTLYPLVIDGLGLGKLSVGAPYFNAMIVPLMVPFCFLMGMGPLSHWRMMPAKQLLAKSKYIFILSCSLGIVLPSILASHMDGYVVLGLVLAFWVTLATLQSLSDKQRWSLADAGMLLAHVGVAVTVIGISLSQAYSVERHVRLHAGDSLRLGPYQLVFSSLESVSGSNYKGFGAKFTINKHKKHLASLVAEKRLYTVSQSTMTDAGISSGLFRDVYVALGERLNETDWSVRAYYKPFIRWIWGGGFLMLFGGVFAALDRRYRIRLPHTVITRRHPAALPQDPVKDEQILS